MPKEKQFTANIFTATQFTTAEAKAKFANHFVKFVLGGFKQQDFKPWFYKQLSNCCGHIAEYDQHGFYATWFNDTAACRRFIDRWKSHPTYGDPAWTFSDVERYLKVWLLKDFDLIIKALDKRREAEEAARTNEAKRVAELADKNVQRFKVWRRSENCGTFGHRQYYVTAEDRSTYTIEIIPSNRELSLNQFIDVPLVNGRPNWSLFNVECPHRLKDCPEALMAEIWGTGK